MASREAPTRPRKISKDEVKGYKAAFKAIDVDGDGRLTAKELKKMMSDIGEDITLDESRAMIREADTDYSGTIEFGEFVAMMALRPRPKSDEDMLHEAFQQFDLNGDGVLTVEELRRAMRSFGENMSKDEVREMIQDADDNGDGVVDYKEFAKMMKS